MFDYVNKINRAASVREINTVLDGLSVGPLQPPEVPTLLSPAGWIYKCFDQSYFRLECLERSHNLQVTGCYGQYFRNDRYDQEGITGTAQSVTGLHGGRLHYWRCSASNSAGTSLWSNVWSLTTGVEGGRPYVDNLINPVLSDWMVADVTNFKTH